MSNWNAEIFVTNSYDNANVSDIYGDFTVMLENRISWFGTEAVFQFV